MDQRPIQGGAGEITGPMGHLGLYIRLYFTFLIYKAIISLDIHYTYPLRGSNLSVATDKFFKIFKTKKKKA